MSAAVFLLSMMSMGVLVCEEGFQAAGRFLRSRALGTMPGGAWSEGLVACADFSAKGFARLQNCGFRFGPGDPAAVGVALGVPVPEKEPLRQKLTVNPNHQLC